MSGREGKAQKKRCGQGWRIRYATIAITFNLVLTLIIYFMKATGELNAQRSQHDESYLRFSKDRFSGNELLCITKTQPFVGDQEDYF